MAKSSHSKTVRQAWAHRLDSAQVREAFDEATVDAYGDYEKHTALLTAIGDEFAFPFSAVVLGETVQVVGMEWREEDGLGLDLVCERNGDQHRIEARSVELVEPFPEGHLFLAAYLMWRTHGV